MSDRYLIPQFIIEYLQKSKSTKNPQKVAGLRLKKFKTPEIEKWFKENEVTAGYIWKYFVFYGLNKFSFRECPVCGKRIKLNAILHNPDAKYCSTKCMTNSKEVQEKYKQTCLENYGVEYPAQSKEVQEKIKQTCIEKYGVENPLQSKEIQEKYKQTCLEKYGVEHTSQLKGVQEKYKQTCLEKYGVENPLQSKEIQEKKKQTCLEKYGVEYITQAEVYKEKSKQTCLEKYGVECFTESKEFKEKSKQTCIEKYGVENPLQSKEISEKRKQTILERYGVEYPAQSKEVQEKIKQTCKEKFGVEYSLQAKEIQEKIFKTNRSDYWETFCAKLKEKNIVPLFSKEEYIKDTGRKFKCLICGEEFVSEGTCESLQNRKRNKCIHSLLSVQHIYCTHCFKARYSKKEKEVVDFVKSIYNGEVLENHKGLFPNKNMELDIYIPNLNLGIEFDGDYWHSKEGAKEKDERKNQLCEEKGIRLIRIKEEDWDTDKEKVKEEIKKYIL